MGQQIPVFGFGSARYGMLGPAEKDGLPMEGGDFFEIYSDEMRILMGYKGDFGTMVSAGASHVCVLTDYVEEKGGKVLSHGLATFGRLGLGTQRRRMTLTDLHKKKSAQSKEKKGIGVKGIHIYYIHIITTYVCVCVCVCMCVYVWYTHTHTYTYTYTHMMMIYVI